MFSNCNHLESIVFPNYRTENATNFSNMFLGCSSLTELDLKIFRTELVTNMGSMFAYCTAMSFLDLSTFNTQKCKNFTNMFEKTINLTVKVNSKNCDNMITAIQDYVDVRTELF